MANIIQAKGKLNGKINSKGSVKGSANPSSGARSYGDLPDKPSINGVEISGDKSAEDYGLKPSDFIVNITKDYMEDTVSADKTYNEISEAYNVGMDCYAIYDSMKIPLYYLNPGAAVFVSESLSSAETVEITIRSYGTVELNFNLLVSSEETYGLVKAAPSTEEDTLPVNLDKNGFLKVSAKPKDFVVNVRLEDNMLTIKSADKTFAQITQAHEEGRDCYVVIDYYGGPFKFYVFNEYNVMANLGEKYVNNQEHLLDLHCNSEDDWTIALSDVKATEYSFGKVKANKKTDSDTQSVNIDPSTGYLYTIPPKFTFNLTADAETMTITADKTYTEIRAAYEAERIVKGIMLIPTSNIQTMAIEQPDYGNNPKILFNLSMISDDKMVFYSEFNNMLIIIDNTNTWTVGY